MIFSRKNTVELPTFEGDVPCELSSEHILPDVYPDVKKILRVGARPVLISRFVSGRRLEFTGAVDYSVLFSCETDGSDEIRSVHFTGDFGGALGELELPDESDIMIVPCVTSCKAKLANPRKLSLRSTVLCGIRVTSPRSCDIEYDGTHSTAEEASAERLSETFVTACSRTFTAEPLHLSESIAVDSSASAVDDIVSCDVTLHFHDVRPTVGDRPTVTLKGTASVECIYRPISDSGRYCSVKRKIPVTHVISAEDFADIFEKCRPDSITARASGVAVEVKTGVGEDSYGERRLIELDIKSEITVRLLGGAESTVTLDAYSVNRSSRCEFAELECVSAPQVVCTNFSVGESIPREDLRIPPEATAVDTQIMIDTPRLEVVRQRGILTACAQASCIFADGEGGFTSSETVIPIRFELPIGDIRTPTVFECNMSVSDLRTRLDDERMYFDFEVSLSAEISEKTRLTAVSKLSVSDDPRSAASPNELILCYRCHGESLWDIAKRYGTTVAAIEAENKDVSRVIVIPHGSCDGFAV